MTPFRVDFDQVNYMKFRPGTKLVLGPEIAIVMASCNKIPHVFKPIVDLSKMVHHPEIEALLFGV